MVLAYGMGMFVGHSDTQKPNSHADRRSFMDLSKHTMIGEIMIARGHITRSQLNMAKKFQETAQRSGEALAADGIISPEDLDVALGWQLAETIVGFGYAGEKEVFGSLRIGVAKENIRVRTSCQSMEQCNDGDLGDFSDF